MGTTAEKLAYLNQTKQQLKTAINNKGGTLTDNDTFRDYVDAVNNLTTGQYENYAGPYTVTQNGTLPTNGKVMTGDLAVNVASSDPLAEAWKAWKAINTTNWSYAFYGNASYGSNVLSAIDNLNNLDFSGSENVKNMNYMFYFCRSLTSAPLFDTSGVTDMNNMFSACSSLTSIPLLNTSKVTNMSYMFYSCNGLTSIPLLNTSNVVDMRSMFANCDHLVSIPALDTSNVTNMSSMFLQCYALKSIPLLNTSKVTNMNYIFQDCHVLTTIPAFDVSNVTTMKDIFLWCQNIEAIHMYGMKVNFSISQATKLTREALLEVINNCQDLTGQTSHKITMGSTNLAKLTAEDKLIATNKNWTLA